MDTPLLTEEAWRLLAGLGFALDGMAIDHCYGPDTPGDGHLHANQVAEIVATMRSKGILKREGHAYATHISHEGMLVHEELCVYGKARGYDVAYDGMRVEV